MYRKIVLVARGLLPAVTVILATAAAHADYITYTESVTGSGALNGTSFSNALVTLTLVGNPLTPGQCTGVPNCTVDTGGPITVDVAGVGTTSLLAFNNNKAQGVVDNSGCPCGGMSVFKYPNGALGNGVLFTFSPDFATYNVTHSTAAAIVGSAGISNLVRFPTASRSYFELDSVSGNATFSALSTLTSPGGTVDHPVTFTEQGLRQISSSIGGLGSQASYEFYWRGGLFGSSASVSGANSSASYAYELSESGHPEAAIATATLDDTDNFTGNFRNIELAPGDYVVGLLADSPNDPDFTINFDTPVDGTAGNAPLPEPSSLALLASAVIVMLLLGGRLSRLRRPVDFA